MQRALIQYRNPKNYTLVREALIQAGREDLIGFGKECLIRPPYGAQRPYYGQKPDGKDGKGKSAARKNGAKGGRPDDRKDSRNGKPGRGGKTDGHGKPGRAGKPESCGTQDRRNAPAPRAKGPQASAGRGGARKGGQQPRRGKR